MLRNGETYNKETASSNHSFTSVYSYDYDAPLSESGHYTEKYYATLEMIQAYDPLYSRIDRPPPPTIPEPVAYRYKR